MTGVVVAVLVFLGIVFAGYGYFLLLLLKYPEPVFAHEVFTIATDDRWQIKLYRRRPKQGLGEPVLLCHSLSSNHLNFEIPAGESMVDALCEAGYECWTIDTRACRSAVPPPGIRQLSATLDDVLLKDLPAALAFIRSKTGFSKVHWIGHSMGGMLLYAYALKFGPDQIASGVTLAAPPGFKNSKLLNRAVLSAVAPFVHGPLSFFLRGLVPVFTLVHPKSKFVPINWDNVHPKLNNGELFHALEMPFPRIGRTMNYWAANRIWRMCGDTLDVQDRLPELQVPLLAVFGAADTLVPREQAKAFFQSLAISDKKMLMLSKHNGCSENYNHIELVFSVKGKEEVFEPAVEWLKAHPAGPRKVKHHGQS